MPVRVWVSLSAGVRTDDWFMMGDPRTFSPTKTNKMNNRLDSAGSIRGDVLSYLFSGSAFDGKNARTPETARWFLMEMKPKDESAGETFNGNGQRDDRDE